MASNTPVSMAEELLNAMYIKPFTGMIPYLSPATSLMENDFEKSPLAKDHWLDLLVEDSHRKGRKKLDPNLSFLRRLALSQIMK